MPLLLRDRKRRTGRGGQQMCWGTPILSEGMRGGGGGLLLDMTGQDIGYP